MLGNAGDLGAVVAAVGEKPLGGLEQAGAGGNVRGEGFGGGALHRCGLMRAMAYDSLLPEGDMLDMILGKRLFPWRRAFLAKFCRIVLPGPADGFPSCDELGTAVEVERYVAGLHPPLRLGLMGLIDLLNILAVFRYARPMMWLSDETARRFLTGLETHPLYELRNAFVAAKALVMLVYYGDVRVEQKTGYVDDCLVAGEAARVHP